MASILDDLKGILGDDAIAKIEGNPALKAKVDKAQELYGYYAGEDDDPPPVRSQQDPPPARQQDPPAVRDNPFDLKSIERMLDTKLGTVNQTIETKLGEMVTARGNELVNNAVKISLQRADELNRIYARHQNDFNEPFDSAKFNEFLESDAGKAGGYKTITSAYEAWVGPRATEKEVDRRVAAKLAERSGTGVGSTPGPSTSNKTIEIFRKRGTAAEGGATTGAQRAAAMLDRLASGA